MKSTSTVLLSSGFFFNLHLFIISFCIPFAVVAQSISFQLSGESAASWQFRKVGDSTWLPATVPGTVHTDLVANNLLPDPYFGDNEKKVQWVENENWEYQAYFDCPDEILANKYVEIQFNGLDTYAAVYLNDSLILYGENMFRTYKVDVRRILHREKNHLLIRFYSAVKKGKEIAAQLPYELAGDLDGKAVTRKAQYQYGWDWGPRLLTCGIWKDITLFGWDRYEIQNIQYTLEKLTADTAFMQLHIKTNGNTDNLKFELHVFSNDNTIHEWADHFTDQSASLSGIHNIHFKIPHPQLWWCNGMGSPFEYQATLSWFDINTGSLDDPTLIEILEFNLAIRTIEVIQDADTAGSSFYFRLNSVPVFIKGANYIPPDNFLPRVSKEGYEKLIDDAVACNMNMLRVWGGGTYADDAFYDLCDEKGILLWQDFMFAGAVLPGDSGFLENVKQEAIDNVIRLRNHPSLALWCGNNEIDEAWHNWGWQQQYHYTDSVQEKLWNDYQKIFHSIIPEVIKQYDPQHFYWPSSPSIGWGHKESLQKGDSHYWGVWWGKEPFDNYNKKVGRFMSEYGFQGMPGLQSIEKFAEQKDRTLNATGQNKFSPVMNIHQKHPTGFETIDEYLQRDYKTPKDFESYVYVSQLLQRDGMTTAIEAHRRAKPYCRGTLYWQFNDCWPVTSWSSRDYFGNPKAFQFAVKELYKPLLISVHEENKMYKVFLISDSLHEINGRLQLALLDFHGKKLWSQEKNLIIGTDTSEVVFQFTQKDFGGKFDPASSVLVVSFSNASEILAEKNYYFVKAKELKLSLPKIATNIVEVTSDPGITDFAFQYEVEFSTDQFAKDIFISAENT
ncbi:MAG TPA: glycoside hydrolase family 2 protein, partial [Chitinophagales bacterium]|nr:glycoside hydrolase family 2 protein [Chitinophagales bacterium]